MANEDEIREKEIINFLKKNKNFFIKNSELVNELNFPTIDNSSDKVVDLEASKSTTLSELLSMVGKFSSLTNSEFLIKKFLFFFKKFIISFSLISSSFAMMIILAKYVVLFLPNHQEMLSALYL